jgi:chromosome segregation ATPase
MYPSSTTRNTDVQTCAGRLVSLKVENPRLRSEYSRSSPPPPPLVPIPGHNEEQTMIWRNIAALFTRCEHNDAKIQAFDQNVDTQQQQKQHQQDRIDDLVRVTSDLYQEMIELKSRMGEIPSDLSGELESRFSQMKQSVRKRISKKMQKTRELSSTAAFDADMEIFKYIDTVREEFVDTNSTTREELLALRSEIHEELSELNATYYRDYEMFVRRENDLMGKLDAALKMNEQTNERIKHLEDALMRQIQQARNYADTQVAGDLREEFSTAICREVAFESEVSAKLVQSVNDELTGLITRSNEYHSLRYFGTVEEVKQLRETCQTLKQSIGMVDAELSDVKETVDYMKDEIGALVTNIAEVEDDVNEVKVDLDAQTEKIYRELDRDYYDIKNYVKIRLQRHVRNHHPRDEDTEKVLPILEEQQQHDDPSSMTTREDDIPSTVAAPAPAPVLENDEIVIILDATTGLMSDEEVNETI